MFPISDAKYNVLVFVESAFVQNGYKQFAPPVEIDPINTESLDTTPPPDKRLIKNRSLILTIFPNVSVNVSE